MKKKILTICLIVLILAAVGGVTWLLMSNKITVMFGSGENENQSANAPIVCGEDIIKAYNEAALARPVEGSLAMNVDEEGLRKVGASIKDKSNYGKDPTCQTLLFWMAVRDNDYEAAKALYESVREMHGRRQFADSNIRNSAPLLEWEDIMQELAPSTGDQDGVLIQ